MAGVMPEPGLRLTTFLGYYEADKNLDGDGNPRRGITNFSLKSEAITFRFQYVWPGAKLWGANIETRVGATAYVHAKLSFDAQTPAGLIHRQSTVNGFGDMLFGPALLGRHSQSFHQIAGFEFFLPSGNFNPARLANPGRGNTAVGPAYLFTWYPTDKIEVSVGSIYLYNWKNPDTHYQSGQEVNVDYGLGYDVTPVFQTGMSGYLYKQVTDDKLNGCGWCPVATRGRLWPWAPSSGTTQARTGALPSSGSGKRRSGTGRRATASSCNSPSSSSRGQEPARPARHHGKATTRQAGTLRWKPLSCSSPASCIDHPAPGSSSGKAA
jgi:hypothetical protein